jgi:hypothetical protein
MTKAIVLMIGILASTTVFADSGKYVCTDRSDARSQNAQEALNLLNCDTTKPFSVSMVGTQYPYMIVCCVQK